MLMRDERRAGKAEGKIEGRTECILELLEDLGIVSEELQTTIMNEKDLSVLRNWTKLAAKADSLEQFVQEM